MKKMLKVKGLVGKTEKINCTTKKKRICNKQYIIDWKNYKKTKQKKIIIPNKTSETQRNEGAINIEYKTQ